MRSWGRFFSALASSTKRHVSSTFPWGRVSASEVRTRGDFLDFVLQQPCPGLSQVVFVPEGRTLQDVIAEIRVMGRLFEPVDESRGVWVSYECRGDVPGYPCECRHTELADDFEWRHNGVLVWSKRRGWIGQRK